jgi:hypothetical protein
VARVSGASAVAARISRIAAFEPSRQRHAVLPADQPADSPERRLHGAEAALREGRRLMPQQERVHHVVEVIHVLDMHPVPALVKDVHLDLWRVHPHQLV